MIEEAGGVDGYEFQRLHGMGEALYEALRDEPGAACRVYAPVGGHRDLLAYLVRRLLENGANSSFVSVAADPSVPVATILQAAAGLDRRRQRTRAIRASRCRAISTGRSGRIRRASSSATARASRRCWTRCALRRRAAARPRRCRRRWPRLAADAAMADGASGVSRRGMRRRSRSAPPCSSAPPICWRQRRDALIALLQREGGKTLDDALSEVREAVDFCRYYAAEARRALAPQRCRGRPARRNELHYRGRGVFVCISPWNFPLAIFTGQVAAALAAGNAVVAKPAEQTPLIAAEAVRHPARGRRAAGALHLVPGDGKVGAALVADRARRRRRVHRLDRSRRAPSTARSPPRTARSCR